MATQNATLPQIATATRSKPKRELPLGKQLLYVSAGLGGSFPFRLGAWPEMTVITLKRDLG